MNFKRPRGTNDIFGPEIELWKRVERAFTEVLENYGYGEIRTPIFEVTELFARSVGEGTDIVSKEMYTFVDKGERSMTLRPENTAGVVRAFLEGGLVRRPGVTKFYYVGPMFRYEKPQAGRFRQFHQIGCEAIGSGSALLDVEVIEMVMTVFRRLDFEGLHVVLNSVGDETDRPGFMEYLGREVERRGESFCSTCRERARNNPMRIFDCKEASCREALKEFKTILDFLSDRNREHLERVESGLQRLEVPYRVDGRLVRGLDYYTRTAFEIHSDRLGAQSALCGGGRYDGLIAQCGGPETPATGFSAGLERIVKAMPAEGEEVSAGFPKVSVYVMPLVEEALETGCFLGRQLRRGRSVEVDYTLRTLKKQLANASKRSVRWAIILGEDELASGRAVLKDLKTASQESVTFENLEKALVEREHHD